MVGAAVAMGLAFGGELPDSAGAVTRTQGSSLTAANTTFDCDQRYLPDFGGTYQPYFTKIPSTCSMWSPGTTVTNTDLVPGTGTVTKVRVKSGPNPAPLKVITGRRLFQTNPNNPNEITDATCCMGVYESEQFQPKPNAVTEVTVNLLVETHPSENGASGWHDFVSVSGVGPGDMPVADVGPHTTAAGSSAGTTNLYTYYPKFEKGASNQNQWAYPGWELLMQYDWIDNPGASTGGGGGGGGGQTKPAVRAGQIRSTGLKLKNGKVPVAVRCASPTKATCRGRVRLLTTKSKLLASKAVTIRNGKTATVSMPLSAAARRKVPGRRPKVVVEVNLGAQGKTVKTLRLSK